MKISDFHRGFEDGRSELPPVLLEVLRKIAGMAPEQLSEVGEGGGWIIWQGAIQRATNENGG